MIDAAELLLLTGFSSDLLVVCSSKFSSITGNTRRELSK
jgi:hypothetical protein